jgi:hypothetical protein
MKKLILFILILASKTGFSCGFDPYGELIRYSLVNPNNFSYYLYSDFYFSSETFGNSEVISGSFSNDRSDLNTALWLAYCKNSIDRSQVTQAVYALTSDDIHPSSSNAMIRYLYSKKDLEALSYLRFAKECSYFNSTADDPWERESETSDSIRTLLLHRALATLKNVRHPELRRRYAFIAIRLAWYNNESERIDSIFNAVFQLQSPKDILYYWSLYFKAITEKNQAKAAFQLAQVFAHAPDKRFACHLNLDKSLKPEQVVPFAQTDEEKANVYLLLGVERIDQALTYLQKIYALNPSSDGLSFLLLRELNKIEDNVLTPYYTLFSPAIANINSYPNNSDNSVNLIFQRSEHDRAYARKVLDFVLSVDDSKIENPIFWKISRAYLSFISRDYQQCIRIIQEIQTQVKHPKQIKLLEMILSLAEIAYLPNAQSDIPANTQQRILSNANNRTFLFAMAKELEYKGKTSEAAMIFANLSISESNNWDNSLNLRSIMNKHIGVETFYTRYFDYIDVTYSVEKVEKLISDLNNLKNQKSAFARFLCTKIISELPLLYDLAGTKYVRLNKLENALKVFEKVDNNYWSRAYTSWDGDSKIFYKNPFYSFKYTSNFIEPVDNNIRLNKFTITRQLVLYVKRANNEMEKNRDYYSFLVANAYFNMGREGNAWMMRRFSSWSALTLSDYEDEAEFRHSTLARQYYLQAMKYAKNDKFKALCLRMLVRCEEQRITYEQLEGKIRNNQDVDAILNRSPYVQLLKTKYSPYYEDLISNCDNFNAYFNARNTIN